MLNLNISIYSIYVKEVIIAAVYTGCPKAMPHEGHSLKYCIQKILLKKDFFETDGTAFKDF